MEVTSKKVSVCRLIIIIVNAKTFKLHNVMLSV